jgi:coproporphyrinogen III oxidase
MQDDLDARLADDHECRDDKVFEPESENVEASEKTCLILQEASSSAVSASHGADAVTVAVPVSLANHTESSSVPKAKLNKEIVLRILRQPDTGLGISIAGGIGSSPYKDNDEVMMSFSELCLRKCSMQRNPSN